MIETIRISDLTVLRALPAHATRPPVLLVHGYFADATVFNDWMTFLATRGVPAYAVNLRGRADSRTGTHLGRASMRDFVEDASRVARELGKPAVIGHSMGGLIAQRLAERDEVSAAVLVTPAPPRGITVLSPRLVRKQLKYLPAILRSHIVQPAREDLRELVLNRVPSQLQEMVLDAFVPDSGRAALDMSITGVPVDVQRVRCPVLVILAADDEFIPKPIGERIAKRYGASTRVFDGRGHMIVIEPGWEDVADVADRWIREQT
ncbi:MAG TPA: alpha/beta hydrolase [Gemmatimonadaceae bacterium]